MSPPIYTPDGSEVSEIVLPDGSTASQVIGPDGNVVFEAGPDIPDSGVSRFEFEQNVTDSWNGYDLTSSGGLGYTTDSQVGSYAASFDGVDDVAGRSGLPVNGSVSFAAWVRNPSGASDRDYIMGAEGFWIGVASDGTYFSRVISNSLGNTGAQVRGQGYTFVATTVSSGGAVTDYVGSSEVYSYSGTAPYLFTNSFQVGNRGNDYSGRYWEGEIDDPRVYSKELTATEVDNLRTTGSISG